MPDEILVLLYCECLKTIRKMDDVNLLLQTLMETFRFKNGIIFTACRARNGERGGLGQENVL